MNGVVTQAAVGLVVTVASFEPVAASGAEQGVVAGITTQQIVAFLALQAVAAVAAFEGVVALAALEGIGPAVAAQQVVALIALDLVVGAAAADGVVADVAAQVHGPAHLGAIDDVIGLAGVALDRLDAGEALASAAGAIDHHLLAFHAQREGLGAVAGFNVALLGPRAHVQQQFRGAIGGGGVVGLRWRPAGNFNAEQLKFRRFVDGERRLQGRNAHLNPDRCRERHADGCIKDGERLVAEVVE